MTYYITCLTGIYAYEDFSISEGQTREASKDVYDYCNKHFGTSGRFTFKTENGKAKAVKVADEKPEPKEEEVVAVKVESKRRKKSE